MRNINNVKEKAFGLVIPKRMNDTVTIDDLLNNEYMVVSYVGHWIMFGATNKDEMNRVLSATKITEQPTIQESIRKMLSNNYSNATKLFECTEQTRVCFISNILKQLNILYSVYGNIIHTSNEDKLQSYLSGETDIPNLSQIIESYRGSFNVSNTLLSRLDEHIKDNMFTTQSGETIIPKPEPFDLLAALSVFVVMTGCKFIESDTSFSTIGDTSNITNFITNNLVIYDKIEVQKK